ncbi:hypothetical protein EXS45_01210, partial [Candidatus Nomurabacteria bacterium]|nr:hypothetical protein [Candidatus Nomurabacteria bacterium]
MSYKNTFRPVCPPASRAGGIFEKRLSLLKFLGVFSALVFLPISNVSAQNFTSDYLINTFRNYIVKSEPQPKADQPMAEDILNAFKNYVTPETLVVPITLPKQIIQSAPIILPEPIAPKTLAAAVLTSPTTISIIQSDILNAFKNYVASPQTETNPPRVEILSVVVKPLSTSSPQVTSNPNSINNVALISALQNLFSKKEFADQLRGPIGPQGPTGLKGDSGTSFINSPSQQPAFIGVIQPNPATNFNGATLFGVTNLSSNNFSTSTANITTLSVSGNSTLTGTLNVTGAATIPNLSTTTSITSPLIIGGTDTTSTLTLRPTSGVGTTNADIIFQIGNNGATEAMRILNSGSVGIGTASPAVTAILDLTSTTKGFLGPRMTTTQ